MSNGSERMRPDEPERDDPVPDQWAALNGCKNVLWFGSQDHCRAAVLRLMVCHPHHFSVTGEGCTLSCSDMAVQCLQSSGLIERHVLVDDGRGWE